jgi:hypothetical protein
MSEPATWRECPDCENGIAGHDCGEDCCPCLFPKDNAPCATCAGQGGWWTAASPEERNHATCDH